MDSSESMKLVGSDVPAGTTSPIGVLYTSKPWAKSLTTPWGVIWIIRPPRRGLTLSSWYTTTRGLVVASYGRLGYCNWSPTIVGPSTGMVAVTATPAGINWPSALVSAIDVKVTVSERPEERSLTNRLPADTGGRVTVKAVVEATVGVVLVVVVEVSGMSCEK